MNQLLPILFIIFGSIGIQAQSRLYISGGVSGTSGGNLNTAFGKELFGYATVDVEWERKMMGPFHSLIGLSYFKAGYFSEEDFFGSMSRFRGNYLAMPIMLRFNAGDKNSFYIDAGPSPYMLLKATLEEGKTMFGTFRTEKADITPYSSRFFLGLRFQVTLAVNRFTLSQTIMFQAQGNNSTRELANHWFLNAQESTYLMARGYSDFLYFGINLGVRIR
jgi:hypothetical protein